MINVRILFLRQINREILLCIRQPSVILYSVLFFLMVNIFFPLTLSSEYVSITSISPGLFWISILLMCLLSSSVLFIQDYECGVIEQWLVSGYPLVLMVSAKIFSYCFLNLLSILIFCPFLALLFNFNIYELFIIVLSFIFGSPTIFFLAAFASALVKRHFQKGALISIIFFPLSIPVIILGSTIINSSINNFPFGIYLIVLLLISLLFMSFLPFVIAEIIRINFND
ncbi:heme exporter protein CcmB [Candidatus Legionella polyplacis]|uniref:Heme exporter protein B n=1 Tax=Candidatus Legionella polyplacis TaxID=2005262 RepID=A0ABZ2GZ30_9GAMM